MARDNSPRERQRRHLERKLGQRASYDRVLIVTEGTKTEPNYFKEIRRAFRLHTANVGIHPGALGTAPIKVVEYAHQLFQEGDRHRGLPPRAFDRVYAVFDRDDHQCYFEALKRAEQLDGKLRNDARKHVSFKAVASVPNFELWLLLHYDDVFTPIHRDEAFARLRKHIPDYAKGFTNAYAVTSRHLPDALRRVAVLASKFTAQHAPEPFTDVGPLVELLTKLKTG